MKKIALLAFFAFLTAACGPATPLPLILSTDTPTPTPTKTFTPVPSPTSTYTPSPTPLPTNTPTPVCSPDLKFFSVAYLQSGIQLSFDAPFEISISEITLNVKVNDTFLTEYSNGLFDPNRLQRLYIVSKQIKPHDKVVVKLSQGETCLLSDMVSVPENYVSPTVTSNNNNSSCIPNQPPFSSIIFPWEGPTCLELNGPPPLGCTWLEEERFQGFDSCGNLLFNSPQYCSSVCVGG